MPEAVDVGSVLGERYKVTAHVLASAEKDLVLDGVDQVLNRSVSILMASADNASQVATSARELATGDRKGNIQVLDLGITDSGTYLVTNRASAADLLDLIVQQDAPMQNEPFVEPSFTDTLGSEIFGRPRSTEPETDDGDHEDQEYEEYDDEPRRPSRLSGLKQRFRRHGDDAAVGAAAADPEEHFDDTSDLPPVVVNPIPPRRPHSHTVPPPPTQRPGGASSYQGRSAEEDDDVSERGTAAAAGAAGVGAAGAASAMASQQPGRAASRFPLSGLRDDESYDSEGSEDADQYDDAAPDEYDDDAGGRKFTRILVGAVLSVVLVIAVVLVAMQLGSISGGTDLADTTVDDNTNAPATEEPTPPAPSASAEPSVAAAEPVISGITRVVPGNQGLDAGNDVNLPLIIDGNPATFWGNQVYASDAFGGLAANLALVVELEEESTISEVTIEQLNGTGGRFTVLVNDRPTLDGAEQIAQGSFTAPTVTLPIPEGSDGPPTGQYVIINFTQLPRLSNIQAQFPFGLRIAEVSVS